MVVAKLAPNLRIVLEGLAAEVAKARDEIAINLTANLTATTPVRTGWARANWIPVLGGRLIALTNPKNESAARAAAPTALAEQQSAILTILTQGPSRPLEKILVTNHVPYIGRLADGWSKQRAAGWVELQIEHTVSDFQAKHNARRVVL